MKYFPVFRRTIEVGRSDISTEEIADMLSKNGDIRVTGIDGDCVQCSKINKPEMGMYSFNPDFSITLVKNGETTGLHCLFYLKRVVQILSYVTYFVFLLIQAVALILAVEGTIFPCFIPPIFILFFLLTISLSLRYEARRITEKLEHNVK